MNDDIAMNVPKPQTYEDRQRELHEDQAGMTREEIASLMASNSEATFDPETATAPDHNWVDRGLVMSCEGAGHLSHRHFKVKRGGIGRPVH